MFRSRAPGLCTMVIMAELTDSLVTQPTGEAPVTSNRGRFVSGDRRINLRGRPKGAAGLARRIRAGKQVSGRIRTIFVPFADMEHLLAGQKAPWIINLPSDYRIVGSDVDVERKGVLFTIHSNSFSTVNLGQPIPVFPAAYQGLMYRACPGRRW